MQLSHRVIPVADEGSTNETYSILTAASLDDFWM